MYFLVVFTKHLRTGLSLLIGSILTHISFAGTDLFIGGQFGLDGYFINRPTTLPYSQTAISGASNFLGVDFISRTEGWLAGKDGSVYYSSTAGSSWTNQTISGGGNFNSVDFVNSNTGWVSGTSGEIWKTSNGGNSFTLQDSTSALTLRSIKFYDDQTGWAVGQAGTILSTLDGGSNWAAQTSGTDKNLNSVYFVSDTTGWAVGGKDDLNIILKTTNGGTTWTEQTNITNDNNEILRAVFFANANDGWIAGSGGTTGWTNDGGTTWSIVQFETLHTFRGLGFVSDTKGWVVGDDGAAYKTSDGGLTWNLEGGIHITADLRAISVHDTASVPEASHLVLFIGLTATLFTAIRRKKRVSPRN